MKTQVKQTVGTHLTVTTYSDGTYDMIWDWDALAKEVAAINKPKINFATMTKLELEAYGRTIGIELDRRRKKSILIKQLEEQLKKHSLN